MSTLQTLPSTTDDVLLDNLSAADMLRYARACTSSYLTVKSYIQRHFQLHHLLGRYFTSDEILRFRELQQRTGMFISGSSALQFFDRSFYPESDLDLYLEHRFRQQIARWLTSIGYKFRPKGEITSLEHALQLPGTGPFQFTLQPTFRGFNTAVGKGYLSASMVLDFEKKGPYRKIQLITSHHSPFERLLNFHSTCVMNLITHDKAYCLYPRGTLEERRALTYRVDPTPSNARTLQKYVTRGWDLLEDITRDDFDDPKFAFARGRRYVGDEQCWTIPILPKLDLPESHIEINCWEMAYDSRLEPMPNFQVLAAPRLTFNYVLFLDSELEKLIKEVVLDDMGRCDESNRETYDEALKNLLKWYRD